MRVIEVTINVLPDGAVELEGPADLPPASIMRCSSSKRRRRLRRGVVPCSSGRIRSV